MTENTGVKKLAKVALRIIGVSTLVLMILAVGLVGFLAWCATFSGDPEDTASREAEPARVAALESHVRALAEPRSDSVPQGYDQAESYIEAQLEAMGYEVQSQAVESDRRVSRNIFVETDAESDKLVIIGAHYDGAFLTPGADDNASGVAVGIELARSFAGRKTAPTVRFVFFANEEPPHFRQETMGSQVMTDSLVAAGREVEWMISLEMLGYYDDTEGSQKYPPVLNLFYPTKGNFVAFVGNLDSRDVLSKMLTAYRKDDVVAGYGFAGPTWIRGIDFSDHMPFWNAGYPALMVTDTAFFRNPHYHEPTDTPETLDYERMAHVTTSLERVFEQELLK